jgi:hypothetical protein
MVPVPKRPKIYHITHIDNLASMVDDLIWSDAERIRRGLQCEVVGMTEIKRRRLEELEVECHAGTKVGEYVPFYFCPRSIMLYLLHMGNHPDLTYRGGQGPIVHLEADLRNVVASTETTGRNWAFSKGNAGARYAEFFKDMARLSEINWTAVAAATWRDPDLKEGKQAEFLVQECFPWQHVDTIGVISEQMANQVKGIIGGAEHQPSVLVQPAWYY